MAWRALKSPSLRCCTITRLYGGVLEEPPPNAAMSEPKQPAYIRLPFSVSAFSGAKRCNPCLRGVLLLCLGTVKARGSYRCCLQKAAQGNLPKVTQGL
jgi:hypothetical protein